MCDVYVECIICWFGSMTWIGLLIRGVFVWMYSCGCTKKVWVVPVSETISAVAGEWACTLLNVV